MASEQIVERTTDRVIGVIDGAVGQGFGEVDLCGGMLVIVVRQREGAPLMNGDLVEVVRLAATYERADDDAGGPDGR